MEKENIVRSIEVIGTALALTIAVSVLVPAQDASANNTSPNIHGLEQQPSLIEHYTIDL